MSAPLLCDGCNQEARRNNEDIIPLQRCSRCRKALYHDRICQAKHYPEHRAICARASELSTNKAVEDQGIARDVLKQTSRASVDPITQNSQSLYSIQHIPGKGKSVTAVTSLDAGTFLPSNQDEGILPLIHPVLFQSCRRSHCVWCFGELSGSTKQTLFEHSIASYFVCSSTCRERMSSTLLDEIKAVTNIYPSSGHTLGPPVLLPTALLVFRMTHVVKHGIVHESALAAMTTHNVPLSEDAKVHQDAIVITVRSLSRASSLSDIEDDTITRFLGYAKYNSFTITHDGAAIGVVGKS